MFCKYIKLNFNIHTFKKEFNNTKGLHSSKKIYNRNFNQRFKKI